MRDGFGDDGLVGRDEIERIPQQLLHDEYRVSLERRRADFSGSKQAPGQPPRRSDPSMSAPYMVILT